MFELDSRSIDDLPSPSSLIEWSKQRLAEVYFLTSFLENINQDFEWTLENSWKIISEHFCIWIHMIWIYTGKNILKKNLDI